MGKKTILVLLCFLVFLYLSVKTSANGGYQVTGNGYNYLAQEKMGSMGLNVKSSNLEGWLRYYYPNMNLISTSITGVVVNGDTVTVTGAGTVEGNDSYTFKATIIDSNPDAIGLEIYAPDGSVYFQAEVKEILKGNFSISVQ